MRPEYCKKKTCGIFRWCLVLTVLLLLVICAAGCEKKTKDFSQDEESESQTVRNLSSSELYDRFIRGEERVYFDRQSYYYFDSSANEEKPYFTDPNGYLLRELIGRIKTVGEVELEDDFCVTEAEYTLLDCGADEEPELCLRVSCNYDKGKKNIEYEFVIKNFDGKLQTCYRAISKNGINRYGFVFFIRQSAWQPDVAGFIDGDGNYHHLYDLYVRSPYDWFGGEDTLSKAIEEVAANKGSEVLERFRIIEYHFREGQEGEAEEDGVKYSYILEVGNGNLREEDLREEDKKLVEEVFDKAGVKLYVLDEIDAMIDKLDQKFGLTSDMIHSDSYEMTWNDIEKKVYWTGKIVTVNSVDEFIKELDNDIMINLEPGTYNLTQWMKSEGGSDKISENLPGSTGVTCCGPNEDYWEIVICRLKNVVISSADPQNPAKIVSEAPCTPVLSFENCNGITLDHLIFGHELNEVVCAGDVIWLNGSSNVNINGCDLYGCGVYGLNALRCGLIVVKDSVIHDCTNGCIRINGGYFAVTNTRFENCRDYIMFDVDDGQIQFLGCNFRNLQGEMARVSERGFIEFFWDCQFDDQALESLRKNEQYNKRMIVH